MKKGKSPYSVFAVGSAMVAAHAHAFEAKDVLSFSIGPLKIRPYVQFTERYDDNVLYRPNGPDKRDDVVTTITPGVNFILGRKEVVNPWVEPSAEPPNFFLVGYELEQNFYALNDNLDYQDHTLKIQNHYQNQRLSVDGSDQVKFLNGVIGGSINLGRKASRVDYSDRYTLQYNLSEKTAVYVTGTHITTDYESGIELLDANTLRGTAGFMWKAKPKTSFFGEFYYGQTAVNPNTTTMAKGPHLEFIGGFAGLQYEWTTKLRSSLKAGFEERQFAGESRAYGSPVVEIDLRYRVTENSAAGLTYSRSSNVSVQRSGVSYSSDNLGLLYNQMLTRSGKIVLALGANYEMDDYSQEGYYANRTDNWWRASLRVTYFIRSWSALALAYEYDDYSTSVLRSGVNVIDYRANRVTLRLAVGY